VFACGVPAHVDVLGLSPGANRPVYGDDAQPDGPGMLPERLEVLENQRAREWK